MFTVLILQSCCCCCCCCWMKAWSPPKLPWWSVSIICIFFFIFTISQKYDSESRNDDTKPAYSRGHGQTIKNINHSMSTKTKKNVHVKYLFRQVATQTKHLSLPLSPSILIEQESFHERWWWWCRFWSVGLHGCSKDLFTPRRVRTGKAVVH